ncbi:MAG: hypothetical protein IPK39_16730 [Sulfuritalea sp.]|nr:hypothetical protein [Sulfuritalea sp.]
MLSFEFRNADRATLRFRLAEWQTGDGIGFQPLADWDATWDRQRHTPRRVKAFRWSQFPAVQEFEAGDWIMGMAVLPRRPSGKFSRPLP